MGSKKKTVVQSNAPWGPIQPYILDIAQQAQNLTGQPINPYTLAAHEQMQSLTGNQGLQNMMTSSLGLLTDPALLSPYSNPYLEQTAAAAARPVTQALTEQVLPNIRSGARSAGQYGGTRQGIAEGIATRGALQSIADQSAGIYSNAYQSGLDTMTRGLAISPSIMSSVLGAQAYPSGLLRQIGAEQEAIPWQRLTGAAGIINPALTAGGTQSQPYYSNPAAEYGGLATGLLGLYAMGAFSSKKLKENFQEVNEGEVLRLVKDVPVEGWSYKGQPEKHIGPYAEDFKEILGIGDGNVIPIVDYLGVLFASVRELAKEVEALKEVIKHGDND